MPDSTGKTDTLWFGAYTAQRVVCRAEIQRRTGFIVDSSYDRQFRDFLFVNMAKAASIKDDDNGVQFASGVFARPDTRMQAEEKPFERYRRYDAILSLCRVWQDFVK
jgi:maltose alpha-D-glucosyltransferase/alpha-amylase